MPAPVELGDEDLIKALLFGPPKSGKSTSAATLANHGKVVVVDTEGVGWLKGPLKKRGIKTENIVKFPAATYADMEDNYWRIQAMFREAEAGQGEAPFAVVVDHMSDLESKLLKAERDRQLDKQIKPLKAKIESGNDENGLAETALKAINQFDYDWDVYRAWTNQAKHILRMYRDLPCHVIFIAHYRTDKGKRVPGMTEKARIDYAGTVNLALGFERQQAGDLNVFTANTIDSESWGDLGDRFDVLKATIVNPSMERVLASMRGELDWNTDPEQQAFKRALTGAK